jgi:hypothetical protein
VTDNCTKKRSKVVSKFNDKPHIFVGKRVDSDQCAEFYATAVTKFKAQLPFIKLQSDLMKAQKELVQQQTRVEVLRERLLQKQLDNYEQRNTLEMLKMQHELQLGASNPR